MWDHPTLLCGRLDIAWHTLVTNMYKVSPRLFPDSTITIRTPQLPRYHIMYFIYILNHKKYQLRESDHSVHTHSHLQPACHASKYKVSTLTRMTLSLKVTPRSLIGLVDWTLPRVEKRAFEMYASPNERFSQNIWAMGGLVDVSIGSTQRGRIGWMRLMGFC